MNFLIAGFTSSTGGLASDGSLRLSDPHLKTTSAVVAYARAFGLAGMSGKFDVVLPYSHLSGSALYEGSQIQRQATGLSDAAIRLSLNFYGAPALSLPEFKSYEQDLIVGGSVQVSAPSGQYDDTRIVNIGTHRWYLKPELGLSKAVGPWILEAATGVTVYSTNTDFFNGNRRSQGPLFSVRGHAIYTFASGIWASIDATYFAGGRTTLNDNLESDLQQNSRAGATLAYPVDSHNSIKLYASKGLSARTGNSYVLVGAAWQYRWGGAPAASSSPAPD
jgi:hypothetical protein